MGFSAGSRIAARGLIWDILGVDALGAQQLLHLRCAAGDLRGMAWDLLTPHEAATELHADLQPERVSKLETWRLHHIACLLDQLPGPAALLSGSPGRLRIEPYQLVPLLRALEMPRPRLLLADGVGLGKTIQAGLIATELIARRRAHRILVVTPAGPLLRQWDQELRHRFGLRFTALTDAAALQAERRRLELGGNPFDAVALCLTSLDFAKQERVLEELERAAWDLTVIDEAHHCIAGPDTEATQRRRLAEVLARRSDGLLLLTATPHDGHDAHFGSLLALLDPSLVDAAGLPAGTAYRGHVVRRLKQHIADPAGKPMFRAREVIPVAVAVPPSADATRAFHEALSALVTPRIAKPGGESLAFVSLLKRSVSTISACVATLRVVAERLGRTDPAETRERARALRAYRRRLTRYGVLDTADEAELADLEAEDVAARLQSDEASALAGLIRLGEAGTPQDPKLTALVAEIRSIRAERPRANVLVYTEYADSQAAAVSALRGAGLTGDILAISGQDDEAARTAAAERCAAADDAILVSTDSLAEGLNLHRRCRDLIHLDLPYNPNRLEQRNGRIDRYGQTEAPQIRYLYLAGTFEERLLLRLIAKYEKARAALDVMPDTLGVTADPADWEPALFEGFAERQASLFEDAPPAIRSLDHAAEALDLDAWRALRQEIDRAYAGFERMAVRHGWFGDRGVQAEPAPVVEAARAHRRNGKLVGEIDLPGFVAAAIGAETGASPCRGPIHVPEAWTAGLDGLPGYDPVSRTFAPQEIGRAHPLVRRAIARARQSEPVVAVAQGAAAPSLLVTYAAELHGPDGLAWQRVLAVHVPRRGKVEVLPDPGDWAAMGDGSDSPSPWHTQFAAWARPRLPEAEAAAMALASRLAQTFLTDRRTRADRDASDLARWMRQRADALCGPPEPRTHDLFTPTPVALDWRSEPAPHRRLALYAADPATTAARRQAANELLALDQDRRAQAERRLALGAPVLRPLGLLMRLP
jgi:hypothetical protein